MSFAKAIVLASVAVSAQAVNMSSMSRVHEGEPQGEPVTVDQSIQDVVTVHDLVTRIYQDAMQQTLTKIYKQHDADESGELSREEALSFFYHVLGVVNQDKELAIAKAAAKIANTDSEAEISREDLEHFVVNLFTGQYAELKYQAANENGFIPAENAGSTPQ